VTKFDIIKVEKGYYKLTKFELVIDQKHHFDFDLWGFNVQK